MGSLLSHPSVYILVQKIIGGHRARVEAIRQYLRPLPGQSILDVGCGPGYMTEYLPGVKYVGIDIDKKSISYATRKHGHRGRFFCREFNDSIIDEFGRFDMAIMVGLLHHLSDSEAEDFFGRTKKVLKPGGRVMTLDGCYVKGQPFIARKFLDTDRGRHVREEKDYVRLASKAFGSVVSHIRQDLAILPYTLIIMELS